jgi:methylated-DNA-[protein]-cysteine S-methyltransferase
MAQARSYALFATAIGTCALAWNDVGLTGVWLPSAAGGSLRRQVLRRAPRAHQSPPVGAIADGVDAMTRLLAGEHVDLDAVALDLAAVDAFDRGVYAAARAVRAGRVLTYGELAMRVGGGATARDVGRSLGRNRWPLVVPCHRVVASGAGLGGFSAPGGTETKRRLLAIEGARRGAAPDLFDAPPARSAGAASGSETDVGS